jgi:type VI protein secretion system component VasF
MSAQDWTVIFCVAALIMWRLDRLGKQIEAVRDYLLVELGNAETKSEALRSRDWEKAERKKERRQFWMLWGVATLAAAIWYAVTQR